MEDRIIQWRPAFVAAMNLELSANRSDLEFEKEYNLNTKPLEIDLLVIKKNKGVWIENEIGSLYKSYGEWVDQRPAEDITVSLMRERKPAGAYVADRIVRRTEGAGADGAAETDPGTLELL